MDRGSSRGSTSADTAEGLQQLGLQQKKKQHLSSSNNIIGITATATISRLPLLIQIQLVSTIERSSPQSNPLSLHADSFRLSTDHNTQLHSSLLAWLTDGGEWKMSNGKRLMEGIQRMWKPPHSSSNDFFIFRSLSTLRCWRLKYRERKKWSILAFFLSLAPIHLFKHSLSPWFGSRSRFGYSTGWIWLTYGVYLLTHLYDRLSTLSVSRPPTFWEVSLHAPSDNLSKHFFSAIWPFEHCLCVSVIQYFISQNWNVFCECNQHDVSGVRTIQPCDFEATRMRPRLISYIILGQADLSSIIIFADGI